MMLLRHLRIVVFVRSWRLRHLGQWLRYIICSTCQLLWELFIGQVSWIRVAVELHLDWIFIYRLSHYFHWLARSDAVLGYTAALLDVYTLSQLRGISSITHRPSMILVLIGPSLFLISHLLLQQVFVGSLATPTAVIMLNRLRLVSLVLVAIRHSVVVVLAWVMVGELRAVLTTGINSLVLGVLLTHALLRLHGFSSSGLRRLWRLVQLREVKEWNMNWGRWHGSLALY